eukprot:CAMPEP_0197628078 /NCGR_PEP_ID=MMETSP1338-20131121/6496_1 /TAXON_ID=43686 ORGANISM="Pelagodinium beii, Strain RCC1491" /NCGR_SAMPLE_ID=MMETSP1338 /ASSEMBLY_ACC=CAM_ASM_000754 /LENGTH=357 /DNA_ID=CAMNT_0043198965 /DNA_START=78 /DNA_END=1151 /DNA_ORIENTATION=-
MAATPDDWAVGAEQGDMQKLNGLFLHGGLDGKHHKVQNAAVVAAYAAKEEAVMAFLEFGVPVDCADKDGKRLLHACCRTGLAKPIEKMIDGRADVNKIDHDKSNALGLALKAKHLGCIKEFLKAGMELPPGNDTIPGLAAVYKEAAVERQTKQLRTLVDTEVDPAEINKAEAQVWESMKAHLTLLKLDTDARAAKVLVELERKADEEQKVALEAQEMEEQMKNKLKNRKIEIAAQETALAKVVKELEEVQDLLKDAKAEDAKLAAELSERRGYLNEEMDEYRAIEKERLRREMYAEKVQLEVKEFEKEVEAARTRNEELNFDLTDAKSELRSWLADKEAAAQLTAQAHALMNGPRDE